MPYPPNLPDLHPIEQVFDRLKRQIKDYTVTSASKEAKEKARSYLKFVWQGNKHLESDISELMNFDVFLGKAESCLQCNDTNFFHG